MLTSEVREKYLKFFESKNHKVIDPAPLVLPDDPTTLFTSSGMQPLVPYLLGEKHPKGKRLVNSQPSFRAVDIEEVGDNRHTTFFEMLGNWSLDDYFKKEQLSWIWEFVTEKLKLPKNRLYVSISDGGYGIEKDRESKMIWKSLGLTDSHIFEYNLKDENWWSRTGSPDEMPVGDIGGPDSELFYEFDNIEHDPKYGIRCHPNDDCGRFLEIGNSVFIQYKKVDEGKFEELPNKNVDFGGGLERLTAATINSPDIFEIDVLRDSVDEVEKVTDKKYQGDDKHNMRIIADHVKASVFLIKNGVEPSNKLQGYVLRRLIRRSAVKLHQLGGGLDPQELFAIADRGVLKSYDGIYLDRDKDREKVKSILDEEATKFSKSLDKGLKKLGELSPFDLFQTYGFPPEVTEELLRQKGKDLDWKKYEDEKEKHINKSKSSSKGQFKGGLADKDEKTIRLHTATHLLQAALRKVLGEHVIQKGQNINSDRSRFDFSYDSKLSDVQLKKVEDLVNKKIKEDLPVNKKKMKIEDAEKTGAIHAFGEKYGEEVNVYFVGESLESAFSKEFCGGPHVGKTSEIGRVRIKKQDKIGSGVIRIYLELA